MQEDVLGPRKDVTGDDYVFCMRCGKAVRRRDAVLIPEEELEEQTVSEQKEICKECLAELATEEG